VQKTAVIGRLERAFLIVVFDFVTRPKRRRAKIYIDTNLGAEHVEQVIGRAHQELESLLKQRAAIIKRIGIIKQTILGLANLFGDDVVGNELLELIDHRSDARQPGFTTTCRTILMGSNRVAHRVGRSIPRRPSPESALR
jgi:hypothetical protein